MKWSTRPHRRRKHRRSSQPFSRSPLAVEVEHLEVRLVLSAAFDVTNLTALRQQPEFAEVDGALTDGTKIGIAIIDSGVLGSHSDLQSNFLAYFDAVSTDANADGVITPADSEAAAGSVDQVGHGTHVAGIAASSNPDIGVAPAAGLIAIRGLPGPGESLPRHDTLLSGLQWVEENYRQYNIKVVNLSIQNGTNLNSMPNPTDFARQVDALESLGITVVAATGNAYADFMALGASFPALHASLSVANTWEDSGVGDRLPSLAAGPNPQYVAIDNAPTTDQLAASSQRSTLANQVAAPGSSIFSTWNDGGFNTISGTSMSSPFVAGLVALVQDAAFTFGGRYLSVDEVVSIIRDSADTIFDSQIPNTQRARLIENGDGSLSLGPIEELLESEEHYQRVNVLNAIVSTRNLVSAGIDPGNDDTNSHFDEAIEFPPLDGSQEFTVSGNIGNDGPIVIGPNDVDLFRIVVESPGQLRVLTEAVPGGVDFDAYLRIFGEEGSEIANQNDAPSGSLYPDLTTGILSPGVYFIGLSSFANTGYDPQTGGNATGGLSTGDYQFTVSLVTPDPNGVTSGAVEVDLTSPDAFNPNNDLQNNGVFVANRILDQEIGIDRIATFGSVDSVTSVQSIPVGSADVDFFRIVAPDTGQLFVEIDTTLHGSEGIDSFLEVFTMDGNGDLQSVDTNDNASDSTTDSFLEIDVAIGQTYFIAVTTASNQNFDPADPYTRNSNSEETGQYDLSLSYTNGDANGTAFGAVDFNTIAGSDGTVQEVIGGDFGQPLLGAHDGFKDVDFFYIDPTEDGLLDVSVTGALDGVVGIWEITPSGTDIIPVVDTFGSSPRIIVEAFAGQRIWVSVTGRGNQGFNWAAPGSGSGGAVGGYSLALEERPASDLPALTDNSISQNTPTPIGLGQTVSGNIGLDNLTWVGSDDVDLFAYTPTVNRLVTVRTFAETEESADTYLRIFDAGGNELAANDDAHGGTIGSEITILLTAGQTYFIGVNGNSPNARDYDPLTGTNAADGNIGSYSLLITEAPPPIYAVGADAGGGPHVRVFDARNHQELVSLFPYDGRFTGGVRVAVGDVTGDGIEDVVTAPGPGGGSHIRVVDGATGQLRSESRYNFFAFQPTMTMGFNVAVGDVNNDGFEDIIVAPDVNSSPAIQVYSGKDGSELHSFFAYDLTVSGGVRVAAGDVNGDGFADIITVPGPGSPAHVRVFDGRSVQNGIGVDIGQTDGQRIGSFIAYSGFQGGAYVAAGDVDGDNLADVILGAGAGGGPHVLVYNASNSGEAILRSFLAYGPAFSGGVRVGATEFGLDQQAEIVTAPGPGGGPHVRLFDGAIGSPNVANDFAFDSFPGGVFVAGSGNYRYLDQTQSLASGWDFHDTTSTPISLSDIEPLREAALSRFANAGLSGTQLELLERVQFSLSDLPGDQLGLALEGTILLDRNAAGVGWFLDATPEQDEEFARTSEGNFVAIVPRARGVDLLSVILHEYGHQLGGEDLNGEHSPHHLMADRIAPGQRRVPALHSLDAVFAGTDLLADLLTSP